MRVLDPNPNSKVPAGLAPKDLLDVFCAKLGIGGLTLLEVGTDKAYFMADKIATLAEGIEVLKFAYPEDKLPDILQEFADKLLARVEVEKLQFGPDWNPEFSWDLTYEELAVAFCFSTAQDLKAIVSRMRTDQWEKYL